MSNAYAMASRTRQPLGDNELRRIAPSIFATEPWGGVSERYTFIPTISVIERLRNEGFVPMMAGQSRARIEGKQEFTRHIIRFQRPSAQPLALGDLVPEIALVNSHDRTSAYSLISGIFRLACTNGLLVSTGGGNEVHHARHSGNIVDEVIEGSYKVIEEASAAIERARELSRISLTAPQQLAFASAAHTLRWGAGEDAKPEAAPVAPAALLRVHRYQDAQPGTQLPKLDAFTTMNVVQENLLQGGLRGRSASGRRTSTRAITSVHEDVRLNKALWVLMEALAKAAK